MTKVHRMTINQVLDKIGSMPSDNVTFKLHTIYEKLRIHKLNHPKGGLVLVENSDQIMQMIHLAMLPPASTKLAQIFRKFTNFKFQNFRVKLNHNSILHKNERVNNF